MRLWYSPAHLGARAQASAGSSRCPQRHLRVAFLPFCPIILKSLKPKPYKAAPESLGEHLRKRRIELGLFQKDVAKQLRVNGWTYLGWEHDRTTPAVSFWPRIIDFLGYDPTPRPNTLGERIASRRRRLGLSQEQAATLVGVDEGTFRRWERGERNPDLALRQRIDLFLSSAV